VADSQDPAKNEQNGESQGNVRDRELDHGSPTRLNARGSALPPP
jgi:hypothetical protein